MAYYYDEIYATIVDYEKQTRFLEKIIRKHLGRRPRSVLDIACGTGNYTFVFAKHGYKATGIDVSEEMLRVAQRKAGEQSQILQDGHVKNTVGPTIRCCDGSLRWLRIFGEGGRRRTVLW